ncbi:MAG: hypothetical protein GXP28_07445 [Planctomycetes bacterium]|nr:hypothetical protein [Planctomycetota bacterium]
MNANTENLDESFPLLAKRAQAEGKLRLASTSESQLRSRLLEMILQSEQNRKCRRDAIPTSRLVPNAQTNL